MAHPPNLGALKKKILGVLEAHPEGLTMAEIREQLGEDGKQEWVNRRVRELRAYYEIPEIGGKYILKGPREKPADDTAIKGKLRAAVLQKAHGRCQMCGKTVAEDGVKLEADHKIPRNWGGSTTEDNLWAICQQCNNGKRDHFASFDADEMNQIVKLSSVYERIAFVLHRSLHNPVPSWFLEFVANLDDFQEDWQKRLRELRYPPIGYKITTTRTKSPSGKWIAAYQLDNWHPLPPNHKFLIKEYEREIRRQRR